MTTEREDFIRPDLNNAIVSRWGIQDQINKALAEEAKESSEFSSTVAKSLSRAWDKIAALWIFPAGGYVTGFVGIVLAVTR